MSVARYPYNSINHRNKVYSILFIVARFASTIVSSSPSLEKLTFQLQRDAVIPRRAFWASYRLRKFFGFEESRTEFHGIA